MLSDYALTAPSPASVRDWRFDIEEFHADYCATLDRGAIEAWPEYFTEDASIESRRARTPMAACRSGSSMPKEGR